MEGNRSFVKGYTTMPHGKAIFHPGSQVFTPTIAIDTPAARMRFDLEFPEAKREHGFMVSCMGQILFWNVHVQDFAVELHALP